LEEKKNVSKTTARRNAREKKDSTQAKTTKLFYPMLAMDYNKKGKLIKFPCYIQPKIDGVRAVYTNNKLYSRNTNQFPNLENIRDELKAANCDLVLDGELYTDEVPFGELVGLVKKQEHSAIEKEKAAKIKYLVFDYIKNEKFSQRIDTLNKFFDDNKFNHIRLLKTEDCKTKEDSENFLAQFISQGHEGLILRNKSGLYHENKRSEDLQKYKKFKDDEFEIVDYKAGTGKEADCVIWVCKTKQGKTFRARPEGAYEDRIKMLKKAKSQIGKFLTVRFQELTTDGIPRFPVGVTIRDFE